MAFITLLVLVVSVPRAEPRWMYWLGILLLATSFPALRHSADGSFEALVIGGILLSVAGYERRRPYLLAGGGRRQAPGDGVIDSRAGLLRVTDVSTTSAAQNGGRAGGGGHPADAVAGRRVVECHADDFAARQHHGRESGGGA